MAATTLPIALAVDDDALVRVLIAEVLSDAGFEVVEAEDAGHALKELLGIAELALLCTDVRMPGRLDGFDLAVLVAALRPAARLIVISGDAGCGPAGLVATRLAKPFAPLRLLSLAREALA